MTRNDNSSQQIDNRPIRPAATLLIVRDTPMGIEVLAVKRAKTMRAFPGFVAFPGGSVEELDYELAREQTVGQLIHEQLPDDAAFAIAALRETAEEIGCLMAIQGHLNAANAHTPLPNGFDETNGGQTIHEVAAARRWQFQLDGIRFVGRWVTPEHVFIPVRYDTRFFIMRGDIARADLRINAGELEWCAWHNAATLLRDIECGREQAAIPTTSMLKSLANAKDVQWCMHHLNVPSPFM